MNLNVDSTSNTTSPLSVSSDQRRRLVNEAVRGPSGESANCQSTGKIELLFQKCSTWHYHARIFYMFSVISVNLSALFTLHESFNQLTICLIFANIMSTIIFLSYSITIIHAKTPTSNRFSMFAWTQLFLCLTLDIGLMCTQSLNTQKVAGYNFIVMLVLALFPFACMLLIAQLVGLFIFVWVVVFCLWIVIYWSYKGMESCYFKILAHAYLYRMRRNYTKKRYTQRTCVVCLNDYHLNDTVIQINCGHIFHDSCLRLWYSVKCTCPICRADIKLHK